MKKFYLPAIAVFASLLTAQAQTQIFTPGNLAVLRISGQGSSSGATETGATNIIDQYTSTGTLVSSFAVPTSGANSVINPGLTDAGLMTMTPDGTKLVFTGYNVSGGLPATGPLTGQSSSTYPRVVATLDAYGDLFLPVKSTSIFSANVIIGATSDGTNFWATGSGPLSEFLTGADPQVVYLGTGAASVQVATNLFSTSVRGVNVFNVGGTLGLFVAGSTTNTSFNTTIDKLGNFVLSNISGALPQTATGASNYFPEGTTGVFPMDIAINPAGTVAYVADNDTGIIKYTNNGSAWISNYTVPLNGTFPVTGFDTSATSVTADWTKTPTVVYATTGETLTNRLVTFQDSNSTAVVTTLAFGTTNSTVTNTFRGVRLVPVPAPFISVPPVAFTGNPGQTATFTATVFGTGNTYQWYSNSVASPTYVPISGATSTNLSLSSITTAQSGSLFYLFATNAYGSTQSAPVSLNVLNPAITAQPVGTTNVPGTGPNNLCVTAVGTGTLTYQWYSNGISLGAGAQSACYSVPNSAVSNSTTYTVVVTNTGAGVTSITSAPTVVTYTPYLIYDTFTYPNGDIFGDAGSPWSQVSGTTPINITNGTVQINQTNGAIGTAIGLEPYTQPQAEGSTVLWASFTINLSTLPSITNPAGGTYFAYFADTNFDFYARLYTLVSNKQSLTPDIPATAYPGTYRLGIADGTAIPSGSSGTGTTASAATAVVELDMSPGITYQVVVYYDTANSLCGMAVNPSQAEYSAVYNEGGPPSALSSGHATDSFTPTTKPMSTYGIRETADAGVFNLDNLEVSYDWNGAGSGYAAVTASVAPAIPVVGFVSPGFTNFAGNSNTIEVAASGIDVTYQWYQGSTPLSDGNSLTGSSTCALTINPEVGSNSGTYTCVVSNSAGPATSSNIVVLINTTPTAPVFTLQPASITNALGGNVTFTATAVGTGPITYAWNTDGSPNGATGSSLTLTGVTTNMTGNYYSVVATGGTSLTATSSNAVLTVTGPIVTNIAYLRSLLVTSAAPTITLSTGPAATAAYQVTGVVTCYTNIETLTYYDYMIQDNTGGIQFFVTGYTTPTASSAARPVAGQVLTVSGTLNIFDDGLELDGSYNNPSLPFTLETNGMGNPVSQAQPTPLLLSWGLPASNPGGVAQFYCGAVCTVTNAYFVTPYALNTNNLFANEGNYTITNAAGVSNDIVVFTGQADGTFTGPGDTNQLDVLGQPIPVFAYSITAPLVQFFTDEYELVLTSMSQIVTNPPPAVTNLTASLSGSNITLNWTAIPTSYTYSVWSTTNLLVPFTPLAPGLWFTNSSGTYSGTVSTNTPAMFFEIVSP